MLEYMSGCLPLFFSCVQPVQSVQLSNDSSCEWLIFTHDAKGISFAP